MRDEKVFPEPEEFRPERHLPPHSGIDSKDSKDQGYLDEANPTRIVFGFGKRCV